MLPRIIAAGVSILWALAVLPPQLLDWSGRAQTPGWVLALYDSLGYAGVTAWLASIGIRDSYLFWGVAIVVSILLAWWAMRPALVALGWWGRVLDVAWPAFAIFTVLSYANWPEDAPLHALWGAEAYLLLAIFAWSIVAGIGGGRGGGAPRWVRVMVALTPVFGIVGTLLAMYWPHSTMIGIGVLALVLACWRGNRPDPADGHRPTPPDS